MAIQKIREGRVNVEGVRRQNSDVVVLRHKEQFNSETCKGGHIQTGDSLGHHLR